MLCDGLISSGASNHRSAVWNGEPPSVAGGGSTTSGAPERAGSVTNVKRDDLGASYAATDHRSAVWNGEPPSVAAEGASEEKCVSLHHSLHLQSERTL